MGAMEGTADEAALEACRQDYESDDQWTLRRKFLQRHWGRYSKNRLICLSQIFINMEFFGCKYNDTVCEEVMELAGDLAVERRAERATVIQKTFQKAASGDDGASPSGAKKSRYGVDASAGKPLKSPFAEPKPKRLGEELPEDSRPPKLLAKDKQMLLIKAQLTIAPASVKSPMDLLNYAASRSKVTWKLLSNEAGTGEVFLTVADVLVVRLNCADPQSAKAEACAEAVRRLKSICLEVREGAYKGGAVKLGLFSSQDKRQGWEGPEDNVFAAQDKALADMREGLAEAAGGLAADPAATLWKVAELCGGQLKEEVVGKSGWSQSVEVRLAGVVVWEGKVKGKESAADAKTRAQAIAAPLTKAHQRVYEDAQGRLRLIASDAPVTDDKVRKALTDESGDTAAGGGRTVGLEAAKTSEAPQQKMEVEQTDDDDNFHETGMAAARRESLYASLVLVHGQDTQPSTSNAKGILNASCQSSGLPSATFETTSSGRGGSAVEVLCAIGDVSLGRGSGATAKEAGGEAALATLRLLGRHCFTLLRKSSIDRSVDSVKTDTLGPSTTSGPAVALPESNVGSKLLRKMGWKGGGVGKEGQGIASPVTVAEVFQRQGLGMSVARGVTREFVQAVEAMLRDYAASDRETDLVFAADFSKEQRKKIHNLAGRFRLKSQSFGGGESRQLAIIKVRAAHDHLQILLRDGGENGKFKLLSPGGLPYVHQLDEEHE